MRAQGRIGDTEPSERVEAGLEQAELIAFGVGKNVPGLLAGLADVGRARPEGNEFCLLKARLNPL